MTAPEQTEQRQVRDAYGFALAMVLVATLALVATGSPLISPLAAAAALLQVGALLLTLRVSGVRRSQSRVAAFIIVTLFVVTMSAVFIMDDSSKIPGLAGWLLLTVLTIAAIARRLITYKQVTVQMLMGLLVIYVLIGMSFGLAYQLSNDFASPALLPDGEGISSAIYFSFITLATVGYGDVTPGTNIVRAMAMAEALIGQLYLVSVVSLAVSRLGARRVAENPESRFDPKAPALAGEDGSTEE